MPIHPRRKTQTRILTRFILELLAGGAVIVAAGGSNPLRGWAWPIALAKFSATRVRQAMKRLRLQGYIRYSPRDAKKPIVLTKKGMARAQRISFRDILKGHRRWDYLWRIVFFDVPERARPVREMLQHEFLNAGFYPLQKSVFACPYSCEKKIMEFCARIRARGFVIFATTASLGKDEERVRRFFFEK